MFLAHHHRNTEMMPTRDKASCCRMLDLIASEDVTAALQCRIPQVLQIVGPNKDFHEMELAMVVGVEHLGSVALTDGGMLVERGGESPGPDRFRTLQIHRTTKDVGNIRTVQIEASDDDILPEVPLIVDETEIPTLNEAVDGRGVPAIVVTGAKSLGPGNL